MNRNRVNKLIAIAGSLLFSNGLLLLVSPKRFARLRQLGWMPQAYNQALSQLPAHQQGGRTAGIGSLALGLLLLLLALRRTEPERAR